MRNKATVAASLALFATFSAATCAAPGFTTIGSHEEFILNLAEEIGSTLTPMARPSPRSTSRAAASEKL